jgi:two-component system sensor histidine kinase TctE
MPAGAGRQPRPTLGVRVVRHVMLPLAFTWLAGTVIALGAAHLFTQRAFDRSLLDDAYLIATNVREQNGGLELALTAREMNTVLFDQDERNFFSVHTAGGAPVAGHAGLRPVGAGPAPGHRFDTIEFEGHALRAVTLRRDEPQPFDVVVGQTTNARRWLLQQLLLYSLPPQLALLLALAAWLRLAITQDLKPLAQLEEAVENRDAQDLSPVPVNASTRDVAGLAGAINSLLKRLERSVRAQREFSGNVAHELRTPLAGIRALAEYGLAQKDPQAWRDHLLEIAASEARASRMVDKLLALALGEEAESHLALAPVALDALVRDAVLRFLPRADAAGVDLGAVGIESPVHVRGDATLIDGILNNLLDNALRYGVDAGVAAPTITVALRAGEGETLLCVEDNGPGLGPEQQASVTARGVQGEAGLQLGQGAGLGLAIVAQYVRLLQARLALGTGAEGRGLACSIALRND